MEQSLNARPLVPASADATDLDALTPNHFLLGTAGSSLLSHCECNFDHRKRYARAQAYSDAIWNRWLREYMPTLNRRFKVVYTVQKAIKNRRSRLDRGTHKLPSRARRQTQLWQRCRRPLCRSQDHVRKSRPSSRKTRPSPSSPPIYLIYRNP